MVERYYTEQRLNANLERQQFQAGYFRNPLDMEQLGGLPPALGASTLPPMGAFSTANDVTNLRAAGHNAPAPAPVALVSPLMAAGALVLAYLAFMPMSGL